MCCLPPHHSLANSFHSCTNIRAKRNPPVPLFGAALLCLVVCHHHHYHHYCSMAAIKAEKKLPRKRKIIQLEMVDVGDVDGDCWRKLHLICYWFNMILHCYRMEWMVTLSFFCYFIRDKLRCNVRSNLITLIGLMTVLFPTNMTKMHHVITTWAPSVHFYIYIYIYVCMNVSR